MEALSAAALSTSLTAQLLGTCNGGGEVPPPSGRPTSVAPPSLLHAQELQSLYVLHSRVFAAATGIAFHFTEPIFRLIVGVAPTSDDPPLSSTSPHSTVVPDTAAVVPAPQQAGSPIGPSPQPATQALSHRHVYQVGAHVVFAPPACFCTCAAFRFQVATKQEFRVCKHILGLHMTVGMHSGARCGPSPLERNPVGDGCAEGLGGARPLPSIRDRYILPHEFVGLMVGTSS